MNFFVDEEGGKDEDDNSDEDSEEGVEDFSLEDDQTNTGQNESELMKDEIKFVETEQVLRLTSADYTSQPSNKVKIIANEMVQKIFTTVSKLVFAENFCSENLSELVEISANEILRL